MLVDVLLVVGAVSEASLARGTLVGPLFCVGERVLTKRRQIVKCLLAIVACKVLLFCKQKENLNLRHTGTEFIKKCDFWVSKTQLKSLATNFKFKSYK